MTALYITGYSVPVSGTGDGDIRALRTAAGGGINVVTPVVNATAGGTNIQWTTTAGGPTIAWISPRLAAGVTLTNITITSLISQESAMTVNAGCRCRIYRYTPGSPPTITELGGGPFDDGVELSNVAQTTVSWGCNFTDTAFAVNDRILIRFYITNVGGTMAAGTCTLFSHDAFATPSDSVINTTETLTFKPEESMVSHQNRLWRTRRRPVFNR